MKRLSQSPTEAGFVQNPYPFYAQARAAGDLVWWEEYGAPCAVSFQAVAGLLKDRRFGREMPGGVPNDGPALEQFHNLDHLGMLNQEPPRHTRLRKLVLKAFTSRRINGLAPEIDALCHRLLDKFNPGDDLIAGYAQPLPVTVIAWLLGVPEEASDDLLAWSNAMVAMYMAGRTAEDEARAAAATTAFHGFLSDLIAARTRAPGDDLLSALIAARDEDGALSHEELIANVILLLNAGHEATVHSIGNATRLLIERDHRTVTEGVVEEALRLDPPLHVFERWAKEDVTVFGHQFAKGDKVNCVLGSAGRDGAAYPDPDRFDPTRTGPVHTAFGGGIHFCVGAPLARLEMLVGLRVLLERFPTLQLADPPRYADIYHKALRVTP